MNFTNIKSFKDFLKLHVNQVLNSISQHKGIFALILLFQIIALTLFSLLLINSSITIAQDLQDISAPLSNIDLTSPEISEQQVLIEGAKLISAYDNLSNHLLKYLLICLAVFFTLPGFIWSFSSFLLIDTEQIASKSINSKFNNYQIYIKNRLFQLLRYYLSYLKTIIITFTPVIILIFLISNFMMSQEITAFVNATYFLSLFIFLAIFYTIILLSFIDKQQFKDQYALTKKLITTNLIHYSLALLLTLLPISASIYFLYYTTLILENFPLMLLAGACTILSITFCRIYLISVARDLVSR